MNTNETLLITGGTGSFGNATLGRFLRDGRFREIRIFSRDEKKQDDMRQHYHDDRIKYYIGDVRDRRSIDDAMRGVDYVFHAAALKQVPSCEFFPSEAVLTNVTGTANVLDSADRHGVRRLILLSTDKAVYPVNAMGMSKALAEKVLVARSRNGAGKTVFCATRYGNVMASRGSVIPLFIEQIRSGRPLTLTDPKMTRFMMSLESAVDLVMYAFAQGRNGDIFVQKAPATDIGTLAEALRQLYGSANPVKIIGTRHGEKLYETLVNREEMAKAEDLGDYYRIPADNRDLNYDKYFNEGEETVADATEYTSHNTRRLSLDETKELLLSLPEIRKELGLE